MWFHQTTRLRKKKSSELNLSARFEKRIRVRPRVASSKSEAKVSQGMKLPEGPTFSRPRCWIQEKLDSQAAGCKKMRFELLYRIGCRQFKYIYKQKYRIPDARDSVLLGKLNLEYNQFVRTIRFPLISSKIETTDGKRGQQPKGREDEKDPEGLNENASRVFAQNAEAGNDKQKRDELQHRQKCLLLISTIYT